MRGSMGGAVRGGAVLNLLIVGTGRVGAEPLYRFTVLGALGGMFIQGYAVTASGQVAGEETRDCSKETGGQCVIWPEQFRGPWLWTSCDDSRLAPCSACSPLQSLGDVNRAHVAR
jgi:hypothetical protein